MKCVIYRRVSTDMQVEKGHSLETQKLRLESYATSQGWTITGDYIDDGYSAKNMDRPQLKKLLKDMEKKEFDIILVYKLDRLCRSVKDLNEMLETFDKYDVKFKSSTETLDTTTATGRMMINIIATLAQWEREQTSERVKNVLRKQKEQGVWKGGTTPFGYGKDNGMLFVKKDEAEIVKYIFKHIKAYGYIKIAKLLNEKGVPSPRTKGLWIAKSVRTIIKNPFYYGKMTYKKDGKEELSDIHLDGYEPIISKEEYDIAQKVTHKRTIEPTRAKSDEIYPFSGIILCPQCGCRMRGTIAYARGRTYKYYRCHSRKGNKCTSPSFRDNVVDEAFRKYLHIPYGDLEIKETNKQVKNIDIDKEIKKLKSKKERAKDLYIDEFITKDEFKERVSSIDEKISELENEAINEAQEISKEAMRETLLFMETSWKHIDDETKALSVRSLFNTLETKKTDRGKLEFIDYTLL